MDPTDLERLLDERLRQLPAPHAPSTLRPRVMAAVASRAHRPSPRPWFAWPRGWQAVFVAALVLAVGGAGLWLSHAWAITGIALPGWGSGLLARGLDVGRDAQAAIDAARTVVRAFVVQPVVLGLVGLVVVMAAACAVFGAMLGRIAHVSVQGAE